MRESKRKRVKEFQRILENGIERVRMRERKRGRERKEIYRNREKKRKMDDAENVKENLKLLNYCFFVKF